MRTPHLRAVSPPQTLQVALYARVSSDQQAEHHTIDSQLAELIARAQQEGHCIRDDLRFIDNGHSGASLIRPALERLRGAVGD
jgi:site-specific DNA recombinase